MNALVDAQGLVVSYQMENGGAVRALDGVDLRMERGERIGLVGESGSGKSTLGMALAWLLAPNARFEAGSIQVDGQPVGGAPQTPTRSTRFPWRSSKVAEPHRLGSPQPEALRRLRRERLGFVFQNPMSALDPTVRVGHQFAWALGRSPQPGEIAEWFARVGLAAPDRVAASFPHELSGGMAQRVVIAMAMARRPALLIADEPTASLDASIQGLILDLLDRLLQESGAGLVLMSHDLRAVARRCQRVLVMYGGRVIESGDSRAVFERPQHPYTQALVRAAAGNEAPGAQLEPIPGVPPVLRAASTDCAFAPRCAHAQARCHAERPALRWVGVRQVACHFATADGGAQA